MGSAEYPAQEEAQHFTQLWDVHLGRATQTTHTGVFHYPPLPHDWVLADFVSPCFLF